MGGGELQNKEVLCDFDLCVLHYHNSHTHTPGGKIKQLAVSFVNSFVSYWRDTLAHDSPAMAATVWTASAVLFLDTLVGFRSPNLLRIRRWLIVVVVLKKNLYLLEEFRRVSYFGSCLAFTICERRCKKEGRGRSETEGRERAICSVSGSRSLSFFRGGWRRVSVYLVFFVGGVVGWMGLGGGKMEERKSAASCGLFVNVGPLDKCVKERKKGD